MADNIDRIGRRRVFYIPGYDPQPPRRYRELYRTESAKQAALSGYEIEMLAQEEGIEGFGWTVEGRMDGDASRARVEVLVWSDIVQESMASDLLSTYWQLIRVSWLYLWSGALRRLAWIRRGPVLAALYPVVMLLAQLALALIVGFTIAALVGRGIASFWGGTVPDWFTWAGWAVHLAIALGVAWRILIFFKRLDNRLFAHYLMHDYAFTAGAKGAYPRKLEERMEAFGNRIAAAIEDGVDEVLVVGHSSGATLAVSILADLIRSGRADGDGELSLLTLGQVIPMQSFLPKAGRLRGDLAFLSVCSDITWVDVSAPSDGCAFALADPVAVTGVAPERTLWPLVISASFSNTLKPATLAAMKRRYFRLHFQYLCAFDNLPGEDWDYDYFRITAGPKSLNDRFVGRPPSPARIDVAASPYRDVAG